MMNKESFIKALVPVEKIMLFQSDYYDLMNCYRFGCGAGIYSVTDPLINTIVELLAEEMGDIYDWIDWWVFETECGHKDPVVKKENIEYMLWDAEGLYYFIKEKRYLEH